MTVCISGAKKRETIMKRIQFSSKITLSSVKTETKEGSHRKKNKDKTTKGIIVAREINRAIIDNNVKAPNFSL